MKFSFLKWFVLIVITSFIVALGVFYWFYHSIVNDPKFVEGYKDKIITTLEQSLPENTHLHYETLSISQEEQRHFSILLEDVTLTYDNARYQLSFQN